MSSKLEQLAHSKRRQFRSLKHEFSEPDIAFRIGQQYEKEDKLCGEFPYDDPSVPTVVDFYRGKDILITGAAGFVGKVLVEKILRSLPEAGRVFLLLRSRKGLSPQHRIQAMLELPIFKLVMTENPKAAERLVAIEGDCSVEGLGLSPNDRQTLIDNVAVVFHCAAIIRFDLTTNELIKTNVRGTRDVVNLCRAMKKLAAFVHVSTAYSNATTDQKTPISEEVLPQEHHWSVLLKAIENTDKTGDSGVLDLIFPKLSLKHTNSYTFTKALAECLVEEEAEDLPSVIVRPTVVVASYEDPFGGWVDNLYGPMSIWEGINRGVVRTHYGDENHVFDYVPVDVHVKVLICAAWHRGIGYRFRPDKKIEVINNGTGQLPTNTMYELRDLMQEVFSQHTHQYILRYPRVFATTNFWIFWLATVTSHIHFGLLMDTVLRIIGKKPLLLSIYRRLYFAQTTLLFFFSSVKFDFTEDLQWKLDSRLQKSDKDRFSFVTIHQPMAYYFDVFKGVIEYIFKEKSYTEEHSNRKMMLIVDWIHNVILALLAVWFFKWLLFSERTIG